MDSFPPLLSSESMISIDLPSAASKEDNISMMSSDSCQMDIMGELHSTDGLGDLHSADAAAVTEIITSCLKDVVDATDVASLEMEHLSINDEDYNELMEERKRHRTSVSSLSYDDNLKKNIVEEACLQKGQEKKCLDTGNDNFKENAPQKDERKNKMTDGKDVGCVVKVNPILVKKDNVTGAAYVSPDVDQDLDAINEIISSSSSEVIITEKSRLHDSGCAKKTSPEDQLSENVEELDKNGVCEIEEKERGFASTAFSPKQEGGIGVSRTVMHAVEFSQDSDGDNETSESVNSESGLRDRGGSSRSKPNKFASSGVPLRRILPKTSIPKSATGTTAPGLDNCITQTACLEASIPSVVQEVICENHISVDGPHPHNWQQSFVLPSPEPDTHPEQRMCVQAQTVISNNIPVQQQIFASQSFNTAPPSYLQHLQQQQQQQQQQQGHCMSPSQTNSFQIHQTTIGQPFHMTPEIHQGSNYSMINTNHSSFHNDWIKNPGLERAQCQDFQSPNSPQLPVDSGLFHEPYQQQQLYLQPKTQIPPSLQQFISPSVARLPHSNQNPTHTDVNQQSDNTLNNILPQLQENSSLRHKKINLLHNGITPGKGTGQENTWGETSKSCPAFQHQLKVSMNKQKVPKRLGNPPPQPGSGKITTMKSAKIGNNIEGIDAVKKSETLLFSQNQPGTYQMNQHFNIPASTHYNHGQNIAFSNNDMMYHLLQNSHASSTTVVPNSNQSQNEDIFFNDTLGNALNQPAGENNETILFQNACANSPSPNSAVSNIDFEQMMKQGSENTQKVTPALGNGHNLPLKISPQNLLHGQNQATLTQRVLQMSKEDISPGDFDFDDLDLNLYLSDSDKISGGSGGRINSGSLEKYLNLGFDDVNNEFKGSQGKAFPTNATKDMEGKHGLFRNGNENSQGLTEVGSIGMSNFNQRMMVHGYSAESKIVSSNLHNCESQGNAQNLDLARKTSELKRSNINLSQPSNSYHHNAHIPVAVHTNPGILQASPLAMGNSLDCTNNFSRMSDQLMPSANNSLNNLSCCDSDTSRSRHILQNSASNNNMNIAVNATSTDNIFPQHRHGQKSSSTHSKNPIKQATSQALSKHIHHKASSSDNSQKKKKSKERHGHSMSSVADWIRSMDGDSDALTGSATAHSMFIPQQEFHDPRIPEPNHHQHHQQHQQLQHHQLVTPVPSSKKSDMSEIHFQSMYNPSNHHPQGHRQRHQRQEQQQQEQQQLQQLQLQLQQQLQQQSTNNFEHVPTSSHNSVAGRHLSHTQASSSLQPQTTTTCSSSSRAQLQHYLQSRGSSSVNTKLSQSQSAQDTRSSVISPRESTKIPRSNNHANQSNDSNTHIRTSSPTMNIKTTTQNHEIPMTKLAEQAVQERGADFAATKILSPSSELLSSMNSSSSVEVTSGDFLDSNLSTNDSSNSSMHSRQHWFQSLGIDDCEETPLHYLCDVPQDPETYQRFKEHKNFSSRVNHLSVQRQTALFVAVLKEKPHVVRFLVESDADVNILCKSEPQRHTRASIEYQTAIHEAVECGNLEIAKILLTYENADVDAKRQSSGLTPLMLALTNHAPPAKDYTRIIQLLLNQRASLTTKDAEGRTPLMFMVMSGDVRIVKTVLNVKGVQVARELVTMVSNRKMMTCLHYAAALKERKVGRERKMELLKLLIQHGADPDKLNAERQSPRHWASNEIAMVMSQLKNKTVTDGASGSDSPRNSPQYKPGAGGEG